MSGFDVVERFISFEGKRKQPYFIKVLIASAALATASKANRVKHTLDSIRINVLLRTWITPVLHTCEYILSLIFWIMVMSCNVRALQTLHNLTQIHNHVCLSQCTLVHTKITNHFSWQCPSICLSVRCKLELWFDPNGKSYIALNARGREISKIYDSLLETPSSRPLPTVRSSSGSVSRNSAIISWGWRRISPKYSVKKRECCWSAIFDVFYQHVLKHSFIRYKFKLKHTDIYRTTINWQF